MKAFVLVLAVFGLAACKHFRPPAAAVHAGSTGLQQTGAALVPAKAETITTRATIPLPAGTEFRVVPVMPADSALAFTLPSSVPIEVETTAERVTGPQAFTPPAPPTPAQEAAGRASLLYKLGLGAGIALAVFGLVRGWDFVMYGGASIAAGCAFGLFVEQHPLLFAVLGAGLLAVVGGPLIWKFKLQKLSAS